MSFPYALFQSEDGELGTLCGRPMETAAGPKFYGHGVAASKRVAKAVIT